MYERRLMVLGPWYKCDEPCRKCGKQGCEWRVWESSDGAHEDVQYRCTVCGHDWWVEGIDS
jgi:hypothetical protein